MNKSELYTFVTQLLSGYQMDTALFDTLLNVSQRKIEGMRPWVKLRKDDASLSASPSDSFTTAKALPADFRGWYGDYPIVLVDANNNPLYYGEVPINEKFSYRNDGGRFYTDHNAGNFYLCGAINQAYTIHQFYLYKPTLVSADDDNTWIFPSDYHPALGLDVALMYRLGVDYDLIQAANGNANATALLAIVNEMTRWDSQLQRSMTTGIDPFGSSSGAWQAGRMPM